MFESIRGQDQAIATLISALKHPVHSYVFYGSRGTFVEEAAREFAALLINGDEDTIERALKISHSDIVEFEPKGVSYRVKEDVRGSMLIESRKSPVEGAKKVLIVHDAHRLRADSANTLLKSIEEPPENVYWILIAPSQDMLLPTIKSRCFAVSFSRLSDEIITEILIEDGINHEKAELATKFSSGRIDRARNLARTYSPLISIARDVALSLNNSGADITRFASIIGETINEIASDVSAMNKKDQETLKKDLKDSGYADRIAKSIMTANKNRIEASEKRLRSDLTIEFLDVLQLSFVHQARNAADPAASISFIEASEKIDDFRKRLVLNPSETLFFESLFASMQLERMQVNS